MINNGLTTALSDHQVLVTINHDSDMKIDFSDLRFGDATATELYPFWIEAATVPVDADIWVRVPMLAAEDTTTIYVYYGNPNATAASDGEATFSFFDDFEGAQIDGAKWSGTGDFSLQNGQLTITSGSVHVLLSLPDRNAVLPDEASGPILGFGV